MYLTLIYYLAGKLGLLQPTQAKQNRRQPLGHFNHTAVQNITILKAGHIACTLRFHCCTKGACAKPKRCLHPLNAYQTAMCLQNMHVHSFWPLHVGI